MDLAKPDKGFADSFRELAAKFDKGFDYRGIRQVAKVVFEAYQAGAFTGNETIEHLYRRTLALCAETDSALEDQWDCFLEVVIAGWCATTIPGFPLSITTPSWPADRWFGEGLKELALEMERCAQDGPRSGGSHRGRSGRCQKD